MAQLTSLKCKECGAPLKVQAGEREVLCPYCGAKSLLSRSAPAVPPPGPQTPAPTGSNGTALALGIGILVVSLGVAGAVVALTTSAVPEGKKTGSTVTSTFGDLLPSPGKKSLRFRGQPLLGKVNADSNLDLIAKCDDRTANHESLCAFDGVTGELLWKGSDLTSDQKDGQTKCAVVAEHILVIDALGKVQAYKTSDGSPAWASVLSERAEEVCVSGNVAVIETADEEKVGLSLENGKKVPVPKGAKCEPVWMDRSETNPVGRLIGWSEFDDYRLPSLHSDPEMSAHRALVPAEGNLRFQLGSKAKGSSIAMIAAVEDRKVLWKDVVPGVDPLGTKVNVTTQLAAYDNGRVAVAYDLKGSEGTRIASFDARTGKRLWDVEVHQASQVASGFATTKDTLYFATWTALYAFRWTDGKLLFVIGEPF